MNDAECLRQAPSTTRSWIAELEDGREEDPESYQENQGATPQSQRPGLDDLAAYPVRMGFRRVVPSLTGQ